MDKNKIKQFFYPTKRKIIIAVIFPIIINIIWYSAIFAYQKMTYEGPDSNIKLVIPVTQNDYQIAWIPIILKIIFALSLQSIYHYPIACFISGILDKRKNNQTITKRDIGKFIMLFVFFNPIIYAVIVVILYQIITSTPYMLNESVPCGLMISSVADDGPSERAWLQEGETILRIYSDEFDYITPATPSIAIIMNRVEVGQIIHVVTTDNDYEVTVGEIDGKPYLGVILMQIDCLCGDRKCNDQERFFAENDFRDETNRKETYSEYNVADIKCMEDCKSY